MGRWRSINFLPYDWVNPNQVITFDQEGKTILTSPDYNEVHNMMFECYSVQPLPKGTLDRKSTNKVQTTKIEMLIIQLLIHVEDCTTHMPIKDFTYKYIMQL